MNRTDRLYALVEELRAAAPRPRTVAQLAARFEMSERTIFRDLQALSESGLPVWSTPGPGGGWAIDPTHTLAPIRLSTAEAMAVIVALTESASSPFGASARSAALKITASLADGESDSVRRLVSRLRHVPEDTEPPSEVGQQLEEALVANQVVRIGYLDRHGEVTSRDVEPYGFLRGRGHWHLFGWCRLREAGRGFRLDRIQSVEATGETAPDRPFEDIAGDLADLAIAPSATSGLLGT